MAVTISPLARQQFAVNGVPLAGGLLFTYAAGTNTKLATYTDSTGATPNTNPIVLDSQGSCDLWLTQNTKYKFVLSPGTDSDPPTNPYWTRDNIASQIDFGAISGSTGATLVGIGTTNVGDRLNAIAVADYAGLRAYAGATKSVYVTGYLVSSAPSPIAGQFVIDDSDSVSADNGGTIFVITSGVNTGKRVKRIYSGGVRPEWFGSYVTGADHTAICQAAINTGLTVDLGGNTYNVNNLTQSTNLQSIISSQGIGRLVKNANGPILTSSADDFFMQNVNWRGDAATPTFTGDGVVATGQRPNFVNCGGRWVSGRALKATGGRVRIKGTCDIYQTTDTSATGYDIEIGVSGTATLYHQIDEVQTTQNTGGILLTDTGSAMIRGGQFGKLTIASGTSPAGVNGGTTNNARILGNITIGLSSAVIDDCQIDAVTVTLNVGTSGCRLGMGNTYANGATIVNNGNSNNRIEREVSTGGTMQTKYGADSSLAVLTMDAGTGDFTLPGNVILPNNKGLEIKDGGGTVQVAAYLSSGNAFQFGANVGTGNTTLASGSGGGYFNVGGTNIAQVWSGGIRPTSDNVVDDGGASQRWANIRAANGTIVTSDGREKQQVRPIAERECAVAARIKRDCLCAYKRNDAVDKKGDAARWHFGVIAQQVADAFAAEGLDPHQYGMFCYDEWPDEPAVFAHTEAVQEVRDERGQIVVPGQPAQTVLIREAIPAGNRFGIRYDELLIFVMAAL